VLLTELTGLLRDTLMMKVAPKGGASLISGGYDGETLRKLGARMTREELLSAMETLQRALGTMRQSTDPRTTAELCLVSLCDNTLGESVGELRARISRLEQQIQSGVVYAAPSSAQAEEETPPPPEEEYPEPAAFPEEDETPAPPPPEPEPVPAAEPEPAPPAPELSWDRLRERLAAVLPRELATRLDDEKSIRAHMEGAMLRLEVMPGFLFGRVNRPEVLDKISAEASALAGREIRATATELADTPAAPRRSLDELKGFKEVHFI
jgi:DNA polymerase-3 subunit gamma/tau